MLKALDTKYKKYLFRSRLEARWAVAFDCMNFEYDYEREGFDLEGLWYLPDFWFPKLHIWAEIRPREAPRQDKKAYLLSQIGGNTVFLIRGNPCWGEHAITIYYEHDHEIMETWVDWSFAQCRKCNSVWVVGHGDADGFATSLLCNCNTEKYPLEGAESAPFVDKAFSIAMSYRF